jgi:anti-sigma regulatory factor (Ser/Thr protein kinase)
VTTAGRLATAHPRKPPYLVTSGTSHRAVLLDVTADASTTVVVMTVHGRWSQDLGSKVEATLQLCLASPVSAVIIDLHDMGDLHGVSRVFWMTAARNARLGAAPVQLALCIPARTMLAYHLRHSDGHRPLLFATMPQARRAIAESLPRTHRVQTRLLPQPISVSTARDLVALVCRRWQMPQLRHDAALVVSELTANAVEHARTDLVLTVSRSGSRLHLAVRDGEPRYPRICQPPRPDDPASPTERGRGLLLVHAVATAWGAIPARGGKVVWATVSPDGPRYDQPGTGYGPR